MERILLCKPKMTGREIDYIRAALAETCAQVLRDAGVYKQDENGRAGVIRFLSTLGYAVR